MVSSVVEIINNRKILTQKIQTISRLLLFLLAGGSHIWEVPTIVICVRKIQYFGKVVVDGGWSLTRGGRRGRFDCNSIKAINWPHVHTAHTKGQVTSEQAAGTSLRLVVNPSSPDIEIHILLTVLHTFRMELVRRICLNIKTSYPWWSLSLFTWMFEQVMIM